MPRVVRTPHCHPGRKHFGRGYCGPCYWAARTAGEFVPERRGRKKLKSVEPDVQADGPVVSLDLPLPPDVQAEEEAFERQQAFERQKAKRRRQARWDAERRERNRLPRAHPLYRDAALHRELLRCGCISWDVVVKIRELRQQAGWSLKALSEFFNLRPSFVALACSHLDLNLVEIPRGQFQVL